MNIGNIIKPALARGELHVIGATTLEDYRKSVEKDAALERRFQPVRVDAPDADTALRILKHLCGRYEAYHHVRVTEEALEVAVRLSDRYLPDRNLPDKAIDILDEACASVRLHSIRDYSGQMGDPVVDADTVRLIVSHWTNIPLTRLDAAESGNLLQLEKALHERIVGQNDAVKAVAQAVRRARAGLKDPHRPAGSFLFLGPTGVGKTELAKALAENLFGDERALIRFDMSEYMEKHTASRLVGAPPGYVGYAADYGRRPPDRRTGGYSGFSKLRHTDDQQCLRGTDERQAQPWVCGYCGGCAGKSKAECFAGNKGHFPPGIFKPSG